MASAITRTSRLYSQRVGAPRPVGALLLALGWLIAGATASPAQNTVTLHGRVAAPDGTPLNGAQVTVLNTETAHERGAVTNADGNYTIVGLAPGAYRVTVTMLGYAQQDRAIRLLAGQRVSLNFELQESAVALAGIQVEAEREPVVEVQRTDVSAPVITTEILNLPLNTRNTINLAAIVPGMKTYAPTAGRSLPSSGSLPDLRFWNFYLDGAEWKSFFNGNLVGIPQTGSPLPQEAMREFRVHLNPYSAEYTRGASYVISAVTQRGTNEFHGSFFAYGQNNALTAFDMFERRAKETNPDFRRADYSRGQFGFNLRGPIQRDKLFFSLSYEGQHTTNTIAVVPGRPAVDPDIWNTYAGSFAAPTRNHTGVLRLTRPVNEEHTLDAVWAARFYDSETFFGGTVARNGGINARYWVHSVQLRDTYTPSPSFVNELSLNVLYWSHSESPLEPGPTLQYPGIRFGTNGFPLILKETHIRLVDRATYVTPDGRHTIKGGLELARVRTNSWLPSDRDGFFRFDTDTSSLPSLARIGVGFYDPESDEDARAVTNGWSVGAYIQDEWQVTRDLQLTLGLRYDAEINTLNNDFSVPWAEDPELRAIPLLQKFLNTGERKNDLNNIAPRLSFSWDVFGNSRTFLRGGAGIMYDRITTFMAFFEKQSAGWRSYEFTNPGTTDPDVLRQRVISGEGASTPNFNLLKTDMKTPENRQFSIGVGHQLGDRIGVNLDYIHQDARNLYVQIQPNWLNTETGRRNLTDSYGTITLYDDVGNAKVDAIVGGVTYDRPGLRLNGALTLGWAESEFEALGNYADHSFLIMQPTTADERWRVVLSGIGDLPYGFTLSGVAIFAAPRPYVATVGQDLNNNNSVADDFIGGPGNRVIRPEANWDNLYRTVDVRLAKHFPLGEGRRVSLSAEAFNIFNWDNISSFGGRQMDAAGNPITNFGQPTGVYAPRQAQLGIRYEF